MDESDVENTFIFFHWHKVSIPVPGNCHWEKASVLLTLLGYQCVIKSYHLDHRIFSWPLKKKKSSCFGTWQRLHVLLLFFSDLNLFLNNWLKPPSLVCVRWQPKEYQFFSRYLLLQVLRQTAASYKWWSVPNSSSAHLVLLRFSYFTFTFPGKWFQRPSVRRLPFVSITLA